MSQENLTEFDAHEIVNKLIGPIRPIGETNADDLRLTNLKQMCKLVSLLVGDIDDVAINNANREEFSMKRAGRLARGFISRILSDR